MTSITAIISILLGYYCNEFYLYKSKDNIEILNNNCFGASGNSLFSEINYDNIFVESGNAFDGVFEVPENITCMSLANKSINLAVSYDFDADNVGEVSLQTNGESGEYFASFNLETEDGNHSHTVDFYIFSENGIDVISNSSMEDAKRRYYIEYLASDEDLYLLGLQDEPNNYVRTKSSRDANYDFEGTAHDASDIVMYYSSSLKNLNGNVRVIGTAVWYDQQNHSHFLSDTLIKLTGENSNGSTIFDSTFSNADGSFALELDNSSFLSSSIDDLYLCMYSTTEATNVLMPLPIPLPYAYCGESFDNPIPNKEYNCEIKIYPWRSDRGGAFEICQAELIPFNYVKHLNNGFSMPMIDIYYPSISSHFIDNNNYFFNSNLYRYISISKDTYTKWDTLNHEYGHYICDYFNLCAESFLATHYINDDYTTKFGVEDGLKLAMSEGLATYIGLASQIFECSLYPNVYLGLNSVGDEYFDGINYQVDFSEFHCDLNANDGDYNFGEGNELTITGLLLKMMDDVERHEDNVAFGHQNMWNMLRYNTSWCISSFVQTVLQFFPYEKENISLLLRNELISATILPNANFSTNQDDACWNFEWYFEQISNCTPNYFNLVFDNGVSDSLSICGVEDLCFSLSSSEINSILALNGSVVNLTVNGYRDYGDNIITGPYSTPSLTFNKPFAFPLCLGQNGDFCLVSELPEWFKFSATEDGLYTFESISDIDLIGQIYEHMVTDDTWIGYEALDDDSGDGYNYRVSIYLHSGESIYLRTVGAYSNVNGSFSIDVSYSHSTHAYTTRYAVFNSEQHKAFCLCGDFILQDHISNGSTFLLHGHRYTRCMLCGQLLDLSNGGFVPVVH